MSGLIATNNPRRRIREGKEDAIRFVKGIRFPHIDKAAQRLTGGVRGYVDLNDGVGLERIQGGVMDDLTVGLNWYLNDNLSFKFDYSYDHRYDLPAASIPGSVRGLGMRMQFIY